MSAVIALVAVCLDTLLGEPRRAHPLVAFGRYARMIERQLQAPQENDTSQRLRGVLAIALALAPWLLLTAAATALPHLELLIGAVVLYLALGHRSLREHARRVQIALQQQDLTAARLALGRMVSRDTAEMNAGQIAAATIESVLENGNDAVFGALFWFAVAGAPGTVGYRLANTLDAMWGYRNSRYRHFGWAAARLDDALNFIPARLTALSYALLGQTARALRCWHRQAPAWDSPNAGPVMAAGAGSLGLQLGGGACYHGVWKQRPALGDGDAPVGADIGRALARVQQTLLLWLALMLMAGVLSHA